MKKKTPKYIPVRKRSFYRGFLIEYRRSSRLGMAVDMYFVFEDTRFVDTFLTMAAARRMITKWIDARRGTEKTARWVKSEKQLKEVEFTTAGQL